MNLQRKVSIELRSSESKSGRLKKCMGVLVGTVCWGEVQPNYTMVGVKKFPCMVSFSCGWILWERMDMKAGEISWNKEVKELCG